MAPSSFFFLGVPNPSPKTIRNKPTCIFTFFFPLIFHRSVAAACGRDQKKVFVKSMLYVGAFLVVWVPYILSLFFYQSMNGMFHYVINFFFPLQGVLNVLIYSDARLGLGAFRKYMATAFTKLTVAKWNCMSSKSPSTITTAAENGGGGGGMPAPPASPEDCVTDTA